MHVEERQRLKFNSYGYEQAFRKLRLAIESTDDRDIYVATGEVLLWVISTDEWHMEHGDDEYRRRKVTEGSGLLLLGMRHAFNMLKHNMKFLQVHQKEGGFTFPISFPLEIPPITVIWMPAGDLLQGRYDRQKQNYENYLESKEVEETFRQVITFLNNENQKYLIE